MTAAANARREVLVLRAYGASPGSHSHGHVQVLLGLDGVLELEIEGRGSRLGPGDALLVAPGERHDFASAGGSRCLVLDTAHAPWTRCAPLPARPRQVQALATYLAQACASGTQPLAALHGPALLLEAWAPTPASTGTRARRAVDWAALTAWVQTRLDQPLTVAQLAERVFLSPSQFAARCREAQGASPLDWLRAQRLAHARALRGAGLSVAQAARRSGYRSPSALTAAMGRAGLRD